MTIREFLEMAREFAGEYGVTIKITRKVQDGWLKFTGTYFGERLGQFQARMVTANIDGQPVELVEVRLKEESAGGYHRYFVSRPVDLAFSI
jgi:hypothetical protein